MESTIELVDRNQARSKGYWPIMANRKSQPSRPSSRSFWTQVWALCWKNLYTAVVRRPILFLLRGYALPIAVLVLLLEIPYFVSDKSHYGAGQPNKILSLNEAIPPNQQLLIIRPPNVGSDIDRVLDTITAPLNHDAYSIVDSEDEIGPRCSTPFTLSDSPCFATLTMVDSPLTNGGNQTWSYIVRTSVGADSNWITLDSGKSDSERVDFPLQMAVDNAITNSTQLPTTIPYTTQTQADVDRDNRDSFQFIMRNSLAWVFIIPFFFQVYHQASAITMERESGMSQLIDTMGGGALIRTLSSIIVCDILYFPVSIAFGALMWALAWRETAPLGAVIGWTILLGLAINHSTTFASSFFTKGRVSTVYIMLFFLALSVGAQVYSQPNSNTVPSTGGVIIFCLLFPSAAMLFFIQILSYWQVNNVKGNLNELPVYMTTPDMEGNGPYYTVKPSVFIGLLAVQIIFYPALALLFEKLLHSVSFRGRSFGSNEGDASAAATVHNLKKTFPPTLMQRILCCFGRKKPVEAVRNVNLIGHHGEILALVGPNGSGKTTTLRLMSGQERITSGTVNFSDMPSQLGICPQANTYWPNLTVREHIKIWSSIKGGHEDAQARDALIDSCDLLKKADSLAGTLSGGQKRKLQLACMFIGDSSVCLIDECTSGLDPLSRRVIWEIILAQREKRSMVFTTHFLDEVEVLADRIAILDKGEIKCEGSAAALKALYGGGYKVSVPAMTLDPNIGFPSVQHQDRRVYTTPDSREAAALASYMRARGMGEISVLGPQIEDVFFNVVGPIDTSVESPLVDPVKLSPGEVTTTWTQIKVLFWKRLIVLRRFWWPYVWVLAVPIVVTPFLKFSFGADPGKIYAIPACRALIYDLSADPVGGVSFQYCPWGNCSTETIILAGDKTLNTSLVSVLQNNIVEASYYTPDPNNPFGGNSTETFDPTVYDSSVVVEQTLDEMVDYVANRAGYLQVGGIYREAPTDAPVLAFPLTTFFPFGPRVINLWNQMNNGIKIITQFGHWSELRDNSSRAIFYPIFFCLIQALYPAAFVLYPAMEKSRQVRALQYANGARQAPLWISYLLFDMIFVVIIVVAVTAILAVQAPFWIGTVGYMALILLLYGTSAVLLNQIVTQRCKGPLSAFFVAFATSALLFVIAIVAFSLSMTMPEPSRADSITLKVSYAINLFIPIGNIWRAVTFGLNILGTACDDVFYVNPGSFRGYGNPIMNLVFQVLAFLGILIWMERENPIPTLASKPRKSDAEMVLGSSSTDVEKECARVEGNETDLLRFLHVTKRFGSKVAVDDVTLGLGEGEVMALLGPNGAGKSTLVNMIHSAFNPDSGSILIKGEDSTSRASQIHLGVCPQHDAIDLMSTRNHLLFYAKLRGVKDPKKSVDTIMDQLTLTPHASKPAGKLSGGNKRKLSLAIALIGMPPVLILDEPTSAMDVVAKRSFWKVVKQVAPGRSILLTTHSMEEADALASRAAITSSRLLAVGTTSALREQYCNVQYVQMQLASAPKSTVEEMETLRQWIESEVPGAKLEREILGGQVRFYVPGNNADSRGPGQESSNRVVDLIELLEREKVRLGIEYYSISGATLENVFLSVVGMNDVKEDEGEKHKRFRFW